MIGQIVRFARLESPVALVAALAAAPAGAFPPDRMARPWKARLEALEEAPAGELLIEDSNGAGINGTRQRPDRAAESRALKIELPALVFDAADLLHRVEERTDPVFAGGPVEDGPGKCRRHQRRKPRPACGAKPRKSAR